MLISGPNEMISMGEQQETTQQFVTRVLAKTETFNKQELADYQRSQLAQLLRLAHTETAFYRKRLAPFFRKGDILDWQKWNDIPVLKRADIKEHGETMIVKNLPKGHGPSYETASSGTTGTPITVHGTYLMLTAGTAAFARACRWYGHVNNDRYCLVMNAAQVEALDRNVWAVGIEGSDRLEGNKSSSRLAVSWTWSAEHILSLMEQHRSSCFSGYATTLENVAEAQMKRCADIKMKFMVGVSMALTPRARKLVTQVFNARTYSAYTSKEVHKVAHECPVSGGFHVNSELVLMEILDDSDKPCAPGETGRVIITPLFGTAQPLIRYELGDLATWGEPCPCGRAHPIIARIDGRIRNQFQFAGGHRFMPGIGHEAFRDLLKADQWQVAQTGPLDVEVRFISPASDEFIDKAAMTDLLQKSYSLNLNVAYRRVTIMPLTPAGKFMDYVNKYEMQIDARANENAS